LTGLVLTMGRLALEEELLKVKFPPKEIFPFKPISQKLRVIILGPVTNCNYWQKGFFNYCYYDFYNYWLAITNLGLVGVAFGGISVLANLLLLWSYESVSAGFYLLASKYLLLHRLDRFLINFFIFILEQPVSGLPLRCMEHFYASFHFWSHDLLHCNLEQSGKVFGVVSRMRLVFPQHFSFSQTSTRVSITR